MLQEAAGDPTPPQSLTATSEAMGEAQGLQLGALGSSFSSEESPGAAARSTTSAPATAVSLPAEQVGLLVILCFDVVCSHALTCCVLLLQSRPAHKAGLADAARLQLACRLASVASATALVLCTRLLQATVSG